MKDWRFSRLALRGLGALHEHGQPLYHCVLSAAGSGFLAVAQALLPGCYAWNASALTTGKSACATRISRLVHEGFLHRIRVSINHRQAGAHRAFRTAAPLLPFLERSRSLRYPLLSTKGATYPSPGQRLGNYGTVTTASPEGRANSRLNSFPDCRLFPSVGLDRWFRSSPLIGMRSSAAGAGTLINLETLFLGDCETCGEGLRSPAKETPGLATNFRPDRSTIT